MCMSDKNNDGHGVNDFAVINSFSVMNTFFINRHKAVNGLDTDAEIHQ